MPDLDFIERLADAPLSFCLVDCHPHSLGQQGHQVPVASKRLAALSSGGSSGPGPVKMVQPCADDGPPSADTHRGGDPCQVVRLEGTAVPRGVLESTSLKPSNECGDAEVTVGTLRVSSQDPVLQLPREHNPATCGSPSTAANVEQVDTISVPRDTAQMCLRKGHGRFDDANVHLTAPPVTDLVSVDQVVGWAEVEDVEEAISSGRGHRADAESVLIGRIVPPS